MGPEFESPRVYQRKRRRLSTVFSLAAFFESVRHNKIKNYHKTPQCVAGLHKGVIKLWKWNLNAPTAPTLKRQITFGRYGAHIGKKLFIARQAAREITNKKIYGPNKTPSLVNGFLFGCIP